MGMSSKSQLMGRRKPGEPPRARVNFTLDAETLATLNKLSEETGIPMSRLVQMGVRLLEKSNLLQEWLGDKD